VRNGSCPWYALSRPRPENEWAFEQRGKIIYPDIAPWPEFAFDDMGFFGGNTTYVIPTNDMFLLGTLNSKVTAFSHRQQNSTIQQGFLRFIALYLRKFPIPATPPAERRVIERLVRRLLALRGEGPEAAALEQELNERVYRLFELTAEETALIEESLTRQTAR